MHSLKHHRSSKDSALKKTPDANQSLYPRSQQRTQSGTLIAQESQSTGHAYTNTLLTTDWDVGANRDFDDPLLGPGGRGVARRATQRTQQESDAVHSHNNGFLVLVILAVLLHASDEPPHWSCSPQHDHHSNEQIVGWEIG